MACAQLVAEHSNTPDINHLVILVPHNNLGRYVVECPTEGRSFISRLDKYVRFACVYRPAEISQFHHIVDQNYILWLEVSVDYTIFVKMNQGINGLPNVVCCLSLSEESFLSEDVE